ncbi:MAG: ABC transporter ATP-binding protein [Clostridiales bacterium]|jgi:putative ABC transport system ATP-binding protein|nr:ABC transporter ATP-binding protein [Clostridiales bacterium]
MSVLELENVSYAYEGSSKAVFSDVTLSFEAGKAYAIAGKSGSGKSTLLHLLGGLDVATRGRVSYGGESLADMNRNRYRARNAGIIFQGLNLLTNASALENIVLSMRISGMKGPGLKAKALELLARVGISPEKASRKILKLSGGEQQRIAIARALAHNPDLIAADEPTGNLDKDTEYKILKIFEDLAHKEGKCVIIATHSKRVTAIADEIWTVDKGVFRSVPTKRN